MTERMVTTPFQMEQGNSASWSIFSYRLRIKIFISPIDNETNEFLSRIVLFADFLTIPKSLILDSFNEANDGWVERQRKIDNVFIHSGFIHIFLENFVHTWSTF